MEMVLDCWVHGCPRTVSRNANGQVVSITALGGCSEAYLTLWNMLTEDCVKTESYMLGVPLTLLKIEV